MSVSSKWISPEEMRGIILICDALDTAWRITNDSKDVSVPFMEDDEGGMLTLPVYDSNGDVLGHVGFTEDGFGLYLDEPSRS